MHLWKAGTTLCCLFDSPTGYVPWYSLQNSSSSYSYTTGNVALIFKKISKIDSNLLIKKNNKSDGGLEDSSPFCFQAVPG